MIENKKYKNNGKGFSIRVRKVDNIFIHIASVSRHGGCILNNILKGYENEMKTKKKKIAKKVLNTKNIKPKLVNWWKSISGSTNLKKTLNCRFSFVEVKINKINISMLIVICF